MNDYAKRNFLSLIIGGNASDKKIVQRVKLLARLFECREVSGISQQDFAKMFGVSESAISQRLNCLRSVFGISRVNREEIGPTQNPT